MLDIQSKIKHNREYYYDILDVSRNYLKNLRLEESIAIIDLAAKFSTNNYCGFYVDSNIEILLNSIGKLIFPNSVKRVNSVAHKKLKILHYATILLDVGGHTRLLENWIKTDKDNSHDVFVSKQNSIVPDFFRNTVKSIDGKIYQFNDELPFVERIRALNEVGEGYDLIVLHHHPDDIIPVIAFSIDGAAPVAILNHGDHKYWVGSSICDILIEIRDNLVSYDKYRREIGCFSLLPIPLKLPLENSYEESRRSLGIDEEEIVLLSIGSEYKFLPFEGKNFFEDIIDILNQNDKAKLFLVGIPGDSIIAMSYPHKNIVYIDPTPEIEIFKQACDIYIEGYPFSSFTAYLEVGVLKKPIHFMYDAPLLNIYQLSAYKNPPVHSSNKENWKLVLLKFINDPQLRLERGNQIYLDILENHVMPGWSKYLDKLYSELRFINHKVSLHFKDNFVLGSNEVYLDNMLGHHGINIIDKIKECSSVYLYVIAYKFFIANDYLDLMFAGYAESYFSEARGWPMVFKVGLVLRMFLNKKIDTVRSLKDVLYYLFKY
jgi:hypothetical protein